MLSERCDLLLTDVDLQVVHGLEVIETLRQVDQGSACLMVTASTAVETAVAAMQKVRRVLLVAAVLRVEVQQPAYGRKRQSGVLGRYLTGTV